MFDRTAECTWVIRLRPHDINPNDVTLAAERLEWLIAQFGPDAIAFQKLALLMDRLGLNQEASQFSQEAARATAQGVHW